MAEQKTLRNVSRFIIGLVLVLAIIYGTNPPSRNTMLTYAVFLVASFVVYNSRIYQRFLIGLGTKKLLTSIIVGSSVAGGFYLLTRFLPGFSLGLPLLPNSISDQLKLIIVVFVAPPAEEIFFRGALLAYLREFNPSESRIQIAIIIQAILFAFAHLGAYVLGFYNYQTLTQGLGAIGANTSVFLTAFVFAYLAGFLVTRKKIGGNLWLTIILHMLLNLIIFTVLTIGALAIAI